MEASKFAYEVDMLTYVTYFSIGSFVPSSGCSFSGYSLLYHTIPFMIQGGVTKFVTLVAKPNYVLLLLCVISLKSIWERYSGIKFNKVAWSREK